MPMYFEDFFSYKIESIWFSSGEQLCDHLTEILTACSDQFEKLYNGVITSFDTSH